MPIGNHDGSSLTGKRTKEKLEIGVCRPENILQMNLKNEVLKLFKMLGSMISPLLMKTLVTEVKPW